MSPAQPLWNRTPLLPLEPVVWSQGLQPEWYVLTVCHEWPLSLSKVLFVWIINLRITLIIFCLFSGTFDLYPYILGLFIMFIKRTLNPSTSFHPQSHYHASGCSDAPGGCSNLAICVSASYLCVVEGIQQSCVHELHSTGPSTAQLLNACQQCVVTAMLQPSFFHCSEINSRLCNMAFVSAVKDLEWSFTSSCLHCALQLSEEPH